MRTDDRRREGKVTSGAGDIKCTHPNRHSPNWGGELRRPKLPKVFGDYHSLFAGDYQCH